MPKQTSNQKDRKIKILFLSANPHEPQPPHLVQKWRDLEREMRAIADRLRGAEFRNMFETIYSPAARPDDITNKLLEHQPDVFHFSGHGTEHVELVLRDEIGGTQLADGEAMVDLFGILADNLRLVVLNACLTEPIARSISTKIEFAVGMNDEIGDEAAIQFAASFYRTLAYGRTIQTAFDVALAELRLKKIPESHIPVLFHRSDSDPTQERLTDPPFVAPEWIKKILRHIYHAIGLRPSVVLANSISCTLIYFIVAKVISRDAAEYGAYAASAIGSFISGVTIGAYRPTLNSNEILLCALSTFILFGLGGSMAYAFLGLGNTGDIIQENTKGVFISGLITVGGYLLGFDRGKQTART